MTRERWILVALVLAVGLGGYALGRRQGPGANPASENDEAHAVAAEKTRNALGEWQASLDDLGAELELTRNQKYVIGEYVEQGREATLSLLLTKREDGGSVLDDLVADLNSGMDPDEAQAAFVEQVSRENVPGSDRTYAARVTEVRNRILKSTFELLEPEQAQKLEELRIDPLNVQTGYDPVRDYIDRKTGGDAEPKAIGADPTEGAPAQP